MKHLSEDQNHQEIPKYDQASDPALRWQEWQVPAQTRHSSISITDRQKRAEKQGTVAEAFICHAEEVLISILVI